MDATLDGGFRRRTGSALRAVGTPAARFRPGSAQIASTKPIAPGYPLWPGALYCLSQWQPRARATTAGKTKKPLRISS